MSARVVWGLAPAGKPHPTAKWSLLIALLVVVVLGVPRIASAGQPAVQAPTGPESGGVFTGTFTFDTYISCTSGLNFNSSYSNNLDGTHTFAFYGAADGSLLVTIDGGGMMLVTSCGDPFTPPEAGVATYTVTKGVAPPPTPSPTPPPPPTPTPSATPTPTHTPSHTPTPTPNGGGGVSGGGTTNGGGSQGSSSSGGSPSDTSSSASSSTPDQSASAPTTAASTAGAKSTGVSPSSKQVPQATKVNSSQHLSLAWAVAGTSAIALLALVLLAIRSRRLREFVRRYVARLGIRIEPYWFRLRHTLNRRIHIHGKTLPKKRGLSAHHHSGKLMAHHHTSYAALTFLLLISCVLAGAAAISSQAASSLVSLTVQGPPPSTAATIDQPLDGQHFTSSSQTVRGTCPAGLFIEIWRNASFAGSTLCDINGLYAVIVTLVPGQNDLIARDRDALDQYGPDSATVTVFYDPPPPPPPSPSPSPAPSASPIATAKTKLKTTSPVAVPTVPTLLLSSDQHLVQGQGVGDAVAWTIGITGGKAPYTITWEWGDGTSDTTYASSSGSVNYQHNYSKAGIYQVTIRATDGSHQAATLQLLVVINGPVTPASLGQSKGDPGNLVYIWPLLTITGLVVTSFWLGEHHKLAILKPFVVLAGSA